MAGTDPNLWVYLLGMLVVLVSFFLQPRWPQIIKGKIVSYSDKEEMGIYESDPTLDMNKIVAFMGEGTGFVGDIERIDDTHGKDNLHVYTDIFKKPIVGLRMGDNLVEINRTQMASGAYTVWYAAFLSDYWLEKAGGKRLANLQKEVFSLTLQLKRMQAERNRLWGDQEEPTKKMAKSIEIMKKAQTPIFLDKKKRSYDSGGDD